MRPDLWVLLIYVAGLVFGIFLAGLLDYSAEKDDREFPIFMQIAFWPVAMACYAIRYGVEYGAYAIVGLAYGIGWAPWRLGKYGHALWKNKPTTP